MKKLAFFLLFLLPVRLSSQSCQISSPLPMPVSIQGCTYNSNLPGGSTSYIQNSSTLQAGATAYPDFLYVGSSETVPTLAVSGLTSGNCVQAGTGGLLTSASGACGSGSGGGSSVYPASSTASFPFGLSASTITISTFTAGDVMFKEMFDNSDSQNMRTLIIQPLVTNQKSIRILFPGGTNAMTIDSEHGNIGFLTDTPNKRFFVNDNIVAGGTVFGQSGLGAPTSGGIFAFQGEVVMTSGSAVVANAIVDSTWQIYLTIQSPSGAVGSVYISSITANTSFNILSTSVADNSTVGWIMMATH